MYFQTITIPENEELKCEPLKSFELDSSLFTSNDAAVYAAEYHAADYGGFYNPETPQKIRVVVIAPDDKTKVYTFESEFIVNQYDNEQLRFKLIKK